MYQFFFKHHIKIINFTWKTIILISGIYQHLFCMAQDNKVQQDNQVLMYKRLHSNERGKMLFIVDQETIIMDQDIVMTNGTIVSILGK
jgi:hypothetical protein